MAMFPTSPWIRNTFIGLMIILKGCNACEGLQNDRSPKQGFPRVDIEDRNIKKASDMGQKEDRKSTTGPRSSVFCHQHRLPRPQLRKNPLAGDFSLFILFLYQVHPLEIIRTFPYLPQPAQSRQQLIIDTPKADQCTKSGLSAI